MKRGKIAAAAICAALCMSLICMTKTVAKSFTESGEKASYSQEKSSSYMGGGKAEEIAYSDKDVYTVGIFGDHVSVFYGKFQEEPAIETEINVGKLREIDRKMLETGITVEDYGEVLKLLEDFNS